MQIKVLTYNCRYGWQLGFWKFKEKKSSICNKFSQLFSNPGKKQRISSGNFTQYASYNFYFALSQSKSGYLLFQFKVLVKENPFTGKRYIDLNLKEVTLKLKDMVLCCIYSSQILFSRRKKCDKITQSYSQTQAIHNLGW